VTPATHLASTVWKSSVPATVPSKPNGSKNRISARSMLRHIKPWPTKSIKHRQGNKIAAA
jgi:hypothetical protein